jgi:cellulose biosynthesis protein BcsQ
MAVVSIASDKGGVAKTSTALLIGSELALDGYQVSILDCDINQQAAAFGARPRSRSMVLGEIAESNVLAAPQGRGGIRGGDRRPARRRIGVGPKSLHRSHFVLIPAQPSMPGDD